MGTRPVPDTGRMGTEQGLTSTEGLNPGGRDRAQLGYKD